MTYLDEIASAIRAAVPRDALPEGDTSQLFLIYSALLLAKGPEVTSADVHDAWVAWMLGRGEEHDSMVPFEELDSATQAEDSPYAIAIRSVAKQMREPRWASQSTSKGGARMNDVRIPLLDELRQMLQREAATSRIDSLDVEKFATDHNVDASVVQGTLAELIVEGLVEGHAETMGHTATDGACRITADGLRYLRGEH